MNPFNWFVILNPTAGHGAALKQWPKIETHLKASGFKYQFQFTETVGHASIIVLNAVKKGFRHIICIGGDGTLHDIVNGLMLQKEVDSSAVSVGIIPIGTGNDWIKTYNIPHRIADAIQVIKNNNTKVQDLGKIEFLDSKKPVLYFNNLAGIGFDGLVAKKTEKLKHLGKLSYLIAACQAFTRFKNFSVEIIYNNNRFTTQSLMVLVGLCKYSGGGMRLTDSPDPKDGLFDVTNVTQFSIWDFIIHLPKLYNGKVKAAKKVNTFKTEYLVILTNKRISGFYLQADGEVIPAENIAVSLIKQAFTFYC